MVTVAVFRNRLDRTTLTLTGAIIALVVGFVWSPYVYRQPAAGEAVRLKQRFAIRSAVVGVCETSLEPLRVRMAKQLPPGFRVKFSSAAP